ncbi:conserved hypothetical protein [Leishmania major strain Friedlin]|uniref:Uncharacterized protein n=1 Tax=Leishmania major TaxID=5664 RepID=Q4QFL2_LEIMA|nr:conserved hypothetical protein [Leishmania major strain Friedlin]CAG9571316.1 hypothetical_protein_-_conserved [Leishmania major strain Friedlin]CAJ03196.1 conserved hypothetical protein [Leishmania major strain Friedlin]|eukprot:XP_001687722.1 conserved hypothetical protein [Leishmania major strain Friedlin]
MSVETQDVEVEVDLSKLIDVGLTFLPLQLTIKDILQRLARLEKENAIQNDHIAQLTANVAELEAAAAAQAPATDRSGDKEDKDAEAEHAALWEEMSRLNELLGELQDDAERGRHTIDEIYAARKHQSSAAAAMTGASSHASLSTVSKSAATPLAHSPASGASASGIAVPAHAARAGSSAPSQRQQDPIEASGSSVPMGDIILSKAHEALELVLEAPYSAFCDSRDASQRVEADHAGGLRGSKSGGQATQDSSPTSAGGTARPRRAVSIVDGPHGPQDRSSVSFPPLRDSPVLQDAHTPASPPQKTWGSSAVWTAATGGEDAGEHREATAPIIEPLPSAQQQLRRPSTYAEKRMTAGAARRTSARAAAGAGGASEAGSPATPPSVFDKLRRDGEDIAYLNRVVAEILGEMKGLHDDFDLLRTNRQESDDATSRPGAVVDSDGLDGLLRRLARVEGNITDARQHTQHRDNQLQEELDDLKRQLRVARGLTDDGMDALRSVADLTERVLQLEKRVRALESGQGMLQEQFANVLAVGDGTGGDGALEVNAIQFAALQGAVKGLEKQLAALLVEQEGQRDWTDDIQKLNEGVRSVEADVESAQGQLQRLQKEAYRLDEVKANRTELPDDSLLEKAQHCSSIGAGDGAAMSDLASRISRAEANIERISESKADRSALHKLRDELNALRQLAELLNAQNRDLGDAEGGRASAAMENMLRELQGELSALKEAHNTRFAGGGLSGEDAKNLMDSIERLDHCKADATLVANKAERDYVENALERLMREVEQVLNATNAGLIDTLEKSLGILRDMIDGKATKQDVANLQGWMSEANIGGGAGAPDGLTGFKGFRCLGCNRPMDNMRPRTLPATMTPFMNRNPQNHPQDSVTRTIQQQHAPPRAGGGGGGQAAVAGVTASSLRSAGSPEGSFHRSTNSEPLPPIEPM